MRQKKNWFYNLSEQEQRLLTHKQKIELRNFDRKVERGNRNWNQLTINTDSRPGYDRSGKGFSLDFILSQKYSFLQPVEREVVKLLVQKYKLTEIALMLGLSYCRVRGLVAKIRDKCKVNSV